MSRDVSTLAIEVTSTGIKEASASLGGLSRSAGNAEKRVQTLTDKLTKLMNVSAGVAAGAGNLNGVMGQIVSALTQASTSAQATARSIAQAVNGFNQLSLATARSSTTIREHNRYGGVFVTTMKAMASATTAYLGVNFIGSIIKQADAWQMMQARLTVVTGSMNNARVAQQQIFEVSQRLRTPLEANAQLYTRLTQPLQRMGRTSKDVIGVVEGVGLAMKLSGTTAAEASSAMLQLSQSFNAGRLNGAEFNSIAEAAPKLLDAIAAKMGVGREQLKKLGSDGKITGQVMTEAILEAKKKWEEDFKNLPITVDDALTRVKNAWAKAMGELNEKSSMNKGLVEAVAVVEQLIPAIRDELASAFIAVMKWVKENKENLGEIWTQVKGIVSDVWEFASAVNNVAGQILGAGENFSIVGFALFSVRLAIAGIQDGLTLVGGLILKAGSYVWEGLISPLTSVVTGPLKFILDSVSGLLDLLARGAEAAGFGGLAQSLRSAAMFGDNLAQTVGAMKSNFDGIGKSMGEIGDAAIEKIASGNGAVSRLLNEQKNVTFEIQKQNMLYDESKNLDKSKGVPDPKKLAAAQKAHEKAVRAANTELDNQVNAYREMAKALDDLEKYGLEGDKRTKLQKDQLEIEEKLRKATDSTARAILQNALNTNIAAQETEKIVKAKRDQLEAEDKYNKSLDTKIAKATEEAKGIEDKIAMYGKAAGAVEEYALQEAKMELLGMKWEGATDTQIAKQQQLVDALQRTQDAKNKLAGLEAGTELDKVLDPKRAIDFGNNLAGAFGKAGKALNDLVKGLEQYDKRSSKIEAIRKDAEKVKLTDQKKYTAAMKEATELETRSRLEGYADMLGAAKQFFKEGSTGYKVLEAAERTYRAFELAMAMKSFLEKSGLLNAFTGLFIASKTTEATAEAASVAPHVAAEGAKQGANGITALTSALAAPFPANIAAYATVAAMLAALGVAVGGGGGGGAAQSAGDIMKDHQSKNGTGTVLGDDTAKSESIAKALDSLRDNSNVGLVYTSEMVASLRNIDMKMGGLTASIARVPGMTTGKNFNANIGTSSSGIQGLFGKTVTREIADTGLKVDGRLSDLINNKGLQQYLDILTTTTRSGFLGIGGGTKTSSSRQYKGVDDELATYIGSIFQDIDHTIIQAGSSLGLSADEMQKRLNDFVLSAEVSLKDLHGEDLQKALESFFSSSADQMAAWAAGNFKEFQRAGEGYFETLTRVATGTEQAKDALSKLGVSMVGLWDIQNKTGNIDTELVRESLMRREAGTNLANIMRLIDGSMEDLISNYKELTRIRNAMQTMGLNGETLSLDLIRGAGGIDALTNAFDSYMENFFSAEEQSTLKMSQLNMEFTRLGLAVPKSRDAFRSLVMQLMQAGPVGEELAGRVLALSDTFSEAMNAYDAVTEERISTARDTLREAYDREAEALENTRDKMKEFANSLKEFKDTLIMGDMSPLSTMEKYQTALQKYEDVSSRAMAGDTEAIGQFQDVANELLKFSREVNASGDGYMADFNRVLAATQLLEQYTQGQAGQAQTQLDALKQQVESLISIEESTKTVAQAIVELVALMGGETPTVTNAVVTGTDAVLGTDPTTAPPLSAAPTVTESTAAGVQAANVQRSNDNMLTELQNLRTEIRTLREEQKAQAEVQVGATYDANDRAADKVVKGYKDVAEDAQWGRNTGLNIA